MKLYVASSWRNLFQHTVVHALRVVGHEVYDFKHPAGIEDKGFHWSEIDPEWKSWTPATFRKSLLHPIAEKGFASDFEAMKWADAGVLVMPCGRSAHLEAGYFVGSGKPLFILLSDGEPELMYKMATMVFVSIPEMVDQIEAFKMVDEDLCGLCGEPGADKIPHPCHWPGEQRPDTELVHAECEQAECARAHAALSPAEREAFLRSI